MTGTTDAENPAEKPIKTECLGCGTKYESGEKTCGCPVGGTGVQYVPCHLCGDYNSNATYCRDCAGEMRDVVTDLLNTYADVLDAADESAVEHLCALREELEAFDKNGGGSYYGNHFLGYWVRDRVDAGEGKHEEMETIANRALDAAEDDDLLYVGMDPAPSTMHFWTGLRLVAYILSEVTLPDTFLETIPQSLHDVDELPTLVDDENE